MTKFSPKHSATTAPRGRPTIYTTAVAEEICRRLATGETLKGICRDEGMPDSATVRGWVLDDRDGFSTLYARAREMQAHGWADDLVDIAEDGSNDWMMRNGKDGTPGYELNGEHVQRSRLRVDTRKWLLAKMMPKTYGDKVSQEHSGPDGSPIPTSIAVSFVPANSKD